LKLPNNYTINLIADSRFGKFCFYFLSIFAASLLGIPGIEEPLPCCCPPASGAAGAGAAAGAAGACDGVCFCSQPANASNTADNKTNFFILFSQNFK
jgi:hypothetical protein